MDRLKSGSQSNQRQDWSLPDHVGKSAAPGRQIVREVLQGLPEGEEIETARDSFLLAFAKPSGVVRFALQSQARLRRFSAESNVAVQERIGIHLGEVVIAEHETEGKGGSNSSAALGSPCPTRPRMRVTWLTAGAHAMGDVLSIPVAWRKSGLCLPLQLSPRSGTRRSIL